MLMKNVHFRHVVHHAPVKVVAAPVVHSPVVHAVHSPIIHAPVVHHPVVSHASVVKTIHSEYLKSTLISKIDTLHNLLVSSNNHFRSIKILSHHIISLNQIIFLVITPPHTINSLHFLLQLQWLPTTQLPYMPSMLLQFLFTIKCSAYISRMYYEHRITNKQTKKCCEKKKSLKLFSEFPNPINLVTNFICF